MHWLEKNNPEYLIKLGEYLGYRYIVGQNGIGYRVDYIAVDPTHPWYQKDYDSIHEMSEVSVHGGLTFSDQGIDSNEWWIGFDCCHSGDAQDPTLIPEARQSLFLYGIMRTTEYVENECKQLCERAEIERARLLHHQIRYEDKDRLLEPEL